MMQAIVSRRGFRDRWILGWVFKDGREQGEQRIFQRENSGNKGSEKRNKKLSMQCEGIKERRGLLDWN